MSVTANQQALRNERGCFERKVPSDAGVTTDMITSTAKCAIDDSLCVRPKVQKPAGRIKLDPSPTLRTRPMSALGQKQTCALQNVMSALHPIATAKAKFRKRPCLLYPRKRTCAVQLVMSALGQ